MYSRKLALSLAKQFRTCPPSSIKKSPSHKQFFQRHHAICPYCSTGLNEDQTYWEKLTDRITDSFLMKQTVTDAADVITGQLRNIRPDLGTWREGYFYKPPCILVLNESETIPDSITVAQTYHDICLASPGDLILLQEHTGAAELFIECWNTYTLKKEFLGNLAGQVTDEIVHVVMELEKNPESLPTWAMLPKPLSEHDPRIYFRELEVEVGYTFASQAAGELIAELEAPELRPGLRLIYDESGKAQEAITEKVSGVQWPVRPRTVEEAFAAAELPADRLPLAADDTEVKSFVGKRVIFRNGRMDAIDPIKIDIYKTHRISGGVAVSGRIMGLLEKMDHSEVICFLEVSETGLVESDAFDWMEKNGSFVAEFNAKCEGKWKLCIALIYYTSDTSGE